METKLLLSIAEAAILMSTCEKVVREKYLGLPDFPWMQIGGKGCKIQIPYYPLVKWIDENWRLYKTILEEC